MAPFFYLYVNLFFFLFLPQKERNKEKSPRKPTSSFVLPTKAPRHISTKLAVRTFRGRQPHYTYSFCTKNIIMKPRVRIGGKRCRVACVWAILPSWFFGSFLSRKKNERNFLYRHTFNQKLQLKRIELSMSKERP